MSVEIFHPLTGKASPRIIHATTPEIKSDERMVETDVNRLVSWFFSCTNSCQTSLHINGLKHQADIILKHIVVNGLLEAEELATLRDMMFFVIKYKSGLVLNVDD